MRCKKLLVSIIAATCLISFPATANVSTGMQQMFDSLGGFANTTPPSSYTGQTMNGYSAGGFYARTPVKTYQLMSMTPPSLNIGCGGIDLTAGAFSFINAAALTAMLKNIGTSISYAFMMAIQASMPQMSNLFTALNDLAQKVNSTQINTCNGSAGTFLKSMEDIGTSAAGVKTAGAAVLSGGFPDFNGAWDKIKDNSTERDKAKAAAELTHPELKEYFNPGNVVWHALDKIAGAGVLSVDEKELIMSFTGTVVISPESAGKPGESLPQRYESKAPLSSASLKSLIGEDPNVAAATVEVFGCADTVACTTFTPGTTITIEPFIYKVKKAIDSLKTNLDGRATQNINNFKFVDAAATNGIPVWKLISVTSINGGYMGLDEFYRLIAVDIAASYMKNLLYVANVAISNGQYGPGTDPGAKAALQTLADNLKGILIQLETERINEYKKVQATADLQRKLQLMQQSLAAGIPSQISNSITVFGDNR